MGLRHSASVSLFWVVIPILWVLVLAPRQVSDTLLNVTVPLPRFISPLASFCSPRNDFLWTSVIALPAGGAGLVERAIKLVTAAIVAVVNALRGKRRRRGGQDDRAATDAKDGIAAPATGDRARADGGGKVKPSRLAAWVERAVRWAFKSLPLPLTTMTLPSKMVRQLLTRPYLAPASYLLCFYLVAGGLLRCSSGPYSMAYATVRGLVPAGLTYKNRYVKEAYAKDRLPHALALAAVAAAAVRFGLLAHADVAAAAAAAASH